MDIDELLSSPWATLMERIREGGYPTNAELAKALRDSSGQPLSHEVRQYLADRLDKTLKRPPHRPQQKDVNAQWAPVVGLALQVRILQAVYQLDGHPSPRKTALEKIADTNRSLRGTPLSIRTLERKIKTLNKAPSGIRNIIPSAQDAARLLAELRAGEGGGDGWLADYARDRFGIELHKRKGDKKVTT